MSGIAHGMASRGHTLAPYELDILAQSFGQPEVEHLDLPPLVHANIRGLDVSMVNALAEGRVQRVRHLNANLRNVRDLPAPGLLMGGQRLSFHELQREIGPI